MSVGAGGSALGPAKVTATQATSALQFPSACASVMTPLSTSLPAGRKPVSGGA